MAAQALDVPFFPSYVASEGGLVGGFATIMLHLWTCCYFQILSVLIQADLNTLYTPMPVDPSQMFFGAGI